MMNYVNVLYVYHYAGLVLIVDDYEPLMKYKTMFYEVWLFLNSNRRVKCVILCFVYFFCGDLNTFVVRYIILHHDLIA